MDLTILVKTFLRDDYLRRCIESIREHHPETPVIVADDGHLTQEKADFLAEHDVSYVHYTPFATGGVSKGRNLLVSLARTEYVLIIEDDMEITEDSNVEQMYQLTEVADIVCGAPLKPSGTVHHYEGWLDVRPGESLTMIPIDQTADETHEGIRFRWSNLGMNILMGRRQTFLDNPWDERFRVVYEHLDYFCTTTINGLQVVYAPDSTFPHKWNLPASGVYLGYRDGLAESQPKFFDKWGFAHVDDMQGWRTFPDGTRRETFKEERTR